MGSDGTMTTGKGVGWWTVPELNDVAQGGVSGEDKTLAKPLHCCAIELSASLMHGHALGDNIKTTLR